MTLGDLKQLGLDLGETENTDQDRGAAWQGYMGTTATPGKVRELFFKRHGCLPKKVIRSGCIMLAGPIIPKVSHKGVTDEKR